MSKDNIGKDVTDAWNAFTKDTDKAKEDIMSMFNDALEEETPDGEKIIWIIFLILGLIGVAILIYKLVNSSVAITKNSSSASKKDNTSTKKKDNTTKKKNSSKAKKT